MAAIGGMCPDASGVCTLSDFEAPRYEDLDSIDSAVGGELSGLVGRRLESVYVVFDARDEGQDAWEFDAPTILRFDGLDVAVESVSGLFLSVSFGKASTGNPLRMYPPPMTVPTTKSAPGTTFLGANTIQLVTFSGEW